MRKATAKLISITIMMIISLCLMTVSSYAYLVLSNNPAVSGVSVTVGGSDTIKLAQNITKELETGEIVNIPGYFDNTVSLEIEGNLKPLQPVSTTDGLTWFIPEKIQNKTYTYTPGVISEEERDQDTQKEFIYDSSLEYGNLPADAETEANGSYIYYDFWVVSPSKDCVLRVSTGNNEGSYVISAPVVVKEGDSYKLNIESNNAASYARVGFLVNDEVQTDNDTMTEYVNQPQYNEAYKKLKGNYTVKGEQPSVDSETKFTVYEPNCDWHPVQTGMGVNNGIGYMTAEMSDGDYIFTYPLHKIANIHILGDLKYSVTAQRTPQWTMVNDEPYICQLFETFLDFMGDKVDDFTEEEIQQKFYDNWLNGYYGKYLTMGKFVTKTSALYAAAEDSQSLQEYVPQDKLETLGSSGATEDIDIVYLERNVPQRIRMFVYLEGQDVDCISSNSVKDLIVHLELAGGNI